MCVAKVPLCNAIRLCCCCCVVNLAHDPQALARIRPSFPRVLIPAKLFFLLLYLRCIAQLKLPAELINTVLEHLVNRYHSSFLLSFDEPLHTYSKLLSPANVDLLMGSGVVDALVLGHTNSAVSAASLESIAASGPALKGSPLLLLAFEMALQEHCR